MSDAYFLAEEREEVVAGCIYERKRGIPDPVAHSDPWEMRGDSVSESQS